MKNLLFFFSLMMMGAAPTSAQLYSHIQSIVPADTNSACVNYYSTRDVSGNIYVTGTFIGTINFPGSGISLSEPVSIPYNDDYHSFIAKLNNDGTWAWAQEIKGTFNNKNSLVKINGIVPDAAGNIFMTGRFAGTAQFGNISITSTSYSSTDSYRATDIFISKMYPDGSFAWVKKEGTNIGPDFGADIIVDPSGNIAIIGSYANKKYNCNGCYGYDSFSSDIFIAKYNTSGVKIWAKRIGNGTNMESGYTNAGHTINTDATGNIYVGGRFLGTVKFDSYTLKSHVAREYDAFAVKLNGNGVSLWAKTGYSNITTAFNRSVLDSSGNIYFGGEAGSNFVYNGISYPGTSNNYLIKLNNNGGALWTSNVDGLAGSGGGQYVPRSIEINSNGNLDLLQINPGTNYLLSYTPGGIHQSTESLENLRPYDHGDLCSSPEGVIVTMTFRNYVILNTASGPDTISVIPSSWGDERGIFIATFVQSSPVPFAVLQNPNVSAIEANVIPHDSEKTIDLDNLNDKVNEIVAYPNPANSIITVQLPGFISVGELRILSLRGKELFSGKVIGGQQLDLDLNEFTPGLYLIDVITPDGHWQKKIIKQ